MVDGGVAEVTFFRFDAGPLDGKSMGIVAELTSNIKIFSKTSIVVASSAGNVVGGIFRL